MTYIGRLYFRKDTGHLLYWYEYETKNDIPIPTVEQDIASLKPLRDFIPENIHVVEVEQDDLLTREKMRRAREIYYDSQTDEVVFDIEPGVLAEIERHVLVENRIAELEGIVGGKAPASIVEDIQKLQQEKSDIEQAIAELSILIAGGGE